MIPKSPHKIEQSLFTKIFSLASRQKWLQEKYVAVQHVIDLAECIEEQDLLIDLLDRFVYIGGSDIYGYLDKLEVHISSQWGLNPSDTVIAPLHNGNDQFADSSQAVCQMFKARCQNKGAWPISRFMSSVAAAVKSKGVLNIVLVDEFIGSGKQALGILRYLERTASAEEMSIKVFIATIAAMKKSQQVLTNKVEDFHATIWLTRGISDHVDSQDVQVKIDLMRALESRLLQKKGADQIQSLGYEQSETIYKCAISTTADNVFPIFHWKWLGNGAARPTILEPRVS